MTAAGGSRLRRWLGLERRAALAVAALDALPFPAFISRRGRTRLMNAAFRTRFGDPGPHGSAIETMISQGTRSQPARNGTDSVATRLQELQLHDGTIYRVITSVPEGMPDALLWTLQDITTERHAVAALAAQEGALAVERAAAEAARRQFYTDAPVAIAVLDEESRISGANGAFAHLCGTSPAELVGRPIATLVAEAQRSDLQSVLFEARRDGRGATCEVTLDRPGEPACRLVLRPADGASMLVHALDTTQQRKLELQFAQSQKMLAVGQLAGGIAHDFNNLLTAMIGFSDLLLLRHTPGDPSFPDIQQIRQNANRAANLVRQLLAFSRQQTLQPRVLDLTDVLADLASLLRRLLGANVELNMQHGRDLGPIRVDQVQLEQVIMNLAVNARDAMPDGGTVTIRTGNAQVTPGTQPPGQHMLTPGTYVTIEVTDTGTGIAPEHLDRIFEPFFSTKEVGAGTGLGLSTVYGIVKQTGGFIFVDSAPGKGAAFIIYLPRYSGDPDAAKPGAAGPVLDLTGAGTILLVEDEDAVRLFGARALRNKGYTVIEASSGDDALDIIEDAAEPIDLLVTDVVMPRMDGPTLIAAAREQRPGLRVICVSGYAEEAFRRRLDGMSDIHFLAKPFSLQQLATKVKDVLR